MYLSNPRSMPPSIDMIDTPNTWQANAVPDAWRSVILGCPGLGLWIWPRYAYTNPRQKYHNRLPPRDPRLALLIAWHGLDMWSGIPPKHQPNKHP